MYPVNLPSSPISEEAANCLSSDLVGDLVYITGPSIEGLLQVSRVDISDSTKVPSVGIIVSKASPTICRVLRSGVFSTGSLVSGKLYFAGVDGRPTEIRPVATPSKVFVQVVGVALDASSLLVSPSFNMVRVI